jgi:hypothetical protein
MKTTNCYYIFGRYHLADPKQHSQVDGEKYSNMTDSEAHLLII